LFAGKAGTGVASTVVKVSTIENAPEPPAFFARTCQKYTVLLAKAEATVNDPAIDEESFTALVAKVDTVET
jgi:hypothetical protein